MDITEILITSSLVGRDLSILKSILNIKSHYADFKFKYSDNSRMGAIFITKTHENATDKYYALLKKDNSTVSIEPNLNPKTLRSLFKYLSQLDSLTFIDENYSQDIPLIDHIYKYINTESNLIMEIKSKECSICDKNPSNSNCSPCQSFHVLLDKKQDAVHSFEKINDNLFMKFSKVSTTDLIIKYFDEVKEIEPFKYSMPLLDFKWKLGFVLHEEIFKSKYTSDEYVFKQISWPDYGHLPFHKEFIQISSILDHKSLSYTNLIDQTDFSASSINQFLNAACFSKNVIILSNQKRPKIKVKPCASPFLSALKNFFSKPLKISSKV